MSARRVEQLVKVGLLIAGAVAGFILIVTLFRQSGRHNDRLLSAQATSQPGPMTNQLHKGQPASRIESEGPESFKKNDETAIGGAQAAQDLPAAYPLKDKTSTSDVSRYSQNIRLQRCLETELAQSIMILDAVVYARVHLGVGRPGAFVLNPWPDSTATVMLRLRDNRPLSGEQVAAIVGLVAGSVPGLKPEKVRVVNQFGKRLSSRLNNQRLESSKTFSDALKFFRQQTLSNLEKVLTPVIGKNNFRISIIPRFNLNLIGQRQVCFLCQPATTTDNLQHIHLLSESGLQPPALFTPRAATQPTDSVVSQAGLFSLFPFKVDELQAPDPPANGVERLSVAVVLNQNSRQVRNWMETQPALDLLNQAAGIAASRGDKLTLNLLDFSEVDTGENSNLYLLPSGNLIRWSERVGMLILILLTTLSALLPVVHHLFGPDDFIVQPDAEPDPEKLSSGLALSPGQQAGENNWPSPDSCLNMKMTCLLTLTENESRRVAEVIRHWVISDEASGTAREIHFPQRSRQEQAAILLLSMGEEAAARTLGKMSCEEAMKVKKIGARLRDVRLTQVRQAMDAFFDDYRQGHNKTAP